MANNSARNSLIKKLRGSFGNVIPEHFEEPTPTKFISSGILSLDYALGGGFARGHISHIWGPDGAGKTTNMVPLCLSVQNDPLINGVSLYIATEPKVDQVMFYRMGVNPDNIIFARTRDVENVLDGNVVMNMIRESLGKVDLIILDSVAGLSPRVVYDMESEDYAIGKVANLLAYQLPLIANVAAATDTALVFLNQQRANFNKFGMDTKPFAGYAIRHWVAVTARMRFSGWLKSDAGIAGYKAKLTVEKNDFAPPRREVEWSFYWEHGIDPIVESINFAHKMGIITLPAGIVRIGDVKLNHPGNKSLDDAIQRVREEPELQKLIREAVLKAET